MNITDVMHPTTVYFIGACLIPLLKGRLRKMLVVLVPILAFTSLLCVSHGSHWTYEFLDYELVFGRVDTLSLCFAYVFVIMSFIGAIYALHLRDSGQYVAAFLYIGGALGVVFAGDLLTLFIFWEIMAFSSVFLIWYRKGKRAMDAGFRYILVHAFGGSCLLAGIVIHLMDTGSITFQYLGLDGPGSMLILVGFMLNAAVPPLHAWLSDAYPKATVVGAVFLSAFTTKTAVYVLLRAFPGTDILIWLGATMALYGVVFAVLENDIRGILAYHIISQVGYMICGVGIGTEIAINGATAHAFSHILYKGLLFMGAGAVIHTTGKRKLTELGGIYRYMPLTVIFYMIGAFSISAFPLFSGFVSKSMVIEAAALDHRAIIWLMLTLASIGTFLHTGLKLPYFTFFGKNKGVTAKEPPGNMLIAMGLAAFLCILIGVYPDVLYNLLPYQDTVKHFAPYTATHVVGTMQLLLFTALGFFLLIKKLGGEATITLDVDWFYRKPAGLFLWFCKNPLMRFASTVDKIATNIANIFLWFCRNPIGAMKHIRYGSHLSYLELRKSEHTREAAVKLEEQKLKHLERHEQISMGLAILLIVLILLAYLLIYVLRLF
ncbi:MAG: Na(+)/H(+) antiporter subunit D [Candidatus Altiarchaeales archaeon]|nr:Na(+)/H(+) antiporter subunit D [Candidatus Altiarchaeales archaeon]